ncbi:histidine kinase [Sphingomonas sp. KR3-1]|uniref:sensor histidine kinase n=1 Tax=Sphingomonas sp. KR3-1 TaxID=3156611 RepID=UPI0032B3F404
MQDGHSTEADSAPALPHRTVLLSIGGFWAFYGAIVTLRSVVIGHGDQLDMLVRRIGVLPVSMAITYLLYLALRRVSTASLYRTIVKAGLLAVPAAIAFSAVNWVAFDVVGQASKAAAQPATASAAKAGGTMVQVGGADAAIPDPATIKMLADGAVNAYFFFASWAALYLALCYAAEVGALERKAAALRAAAQTAELRALRYQVNPHFLFNTLNSLSSLVMAGKRDPAERMIINLASFFRASLVGDPGEDVRLSEEIRLQQLYLEIEQARFPDRLRLAIDLPEELEDALVPGLILQPLIENAVKHGVSRSRRPVTIAIRASRQETTLLLSVQDDGEAIAAGPGADSVRGVGLGLRNVADRMTARFGVQGQRRVEPHAPGGFRVELAMPLSRDAG